MPYAISFSFRPPQLSSEEHMPVRSANAFRTLDGADDLRRRADCARDCGRARRGHERDDRAAEPRAGQARTERTRGHEPFDERVQLRSRDLVVVAKARMT